MLGRQYTEDFHSLTQGRANISARPVYAQAFRNFMYTPNTCYPVTGLVEVTHPGRTVN